MYDLDSLRLIGARLLPGSGRLLNHRLFPALALSHLLVPVALLLTTHATLAAPARQMTDGAAASAVPSLSEPGTAGPGLLIALPPGEPAGGTAAWLRANDLVPLRIWPELNMALVADGARDAEVLPASADQLAYFQQRTEAVPGIRFAAYDTPVYAADLLSAPGADAAPRTTLPPADPRLEEQWSLAAMNVADAWAITSGHPSVPIAVIDSGVEFEHEDLHTAGYWTNAAEANGLAGVDDDDNGYVDDIAGWDWIERDSRPQDLYGHGTHVTGMIGAVVDNGVGIAGVVPSGTILPLRVLDATGVGRLSDLIDAMVYARARGVRILNLSLVLPIDSPALAEAVAQLHDQDLIIFAATGNAAEHVYWPAAYPETVAVGAVDRSGERASFSNTGAEVDLVAPGVDILGTYLDNSYALSSGTSMATANVSGLAALIWSLRPDLARDDLLALLQETAVGTDEAGLTLESTPAGAGRINFLAALQLASGSLMLTPFRTADRTIFTGEPGEVQIRVAPPGSNLGAAGAHVQYALIDPALAPAATPLITGTVDTDAQGVATIHLDTPDKPTDCILRVAVGTMTEEIALAVRSRPADLQLLLDQSVVSADTDATPLRIELRDAEGRWLVGAFPVELSASRGAFDNGASTIEVTARDGRAALDFVPGRATGVALLRAQIGDLHNEQALTVVPAAPAQMRMEVAPGGTVPLAPDLAEPETEDNAPAAAALAVTLHLWDEFDNPVEDNTVVHVSVQGGVPADESVMTRNGTAVTGVWRQSETVPLEITARVPGTDLERSHSVPPAAYHVLLPHVTAR